MGSRRGYHAVAGDESDAIELQMVDSQADAEDNTSLHLPYSESPLSRDNLPPDFASSSASSTRNPWHRVEDLDTFFSIIYRYYRAKGWKSSILSSVLNVLTFGFIAFFVFFLFGCVNWDKLFQLSKEDAPFSVWDAVQISQLESIHPVLVIVMVVFFLFLIYELITLVFGIRSLLLMRDFFEKELFISERELQTISWDLVQEKLQQAQLRLRMCVVKDEIEPIDFAHRVMRQENYLIALVNCELFDVALPLLPNWKFFPRSLEFNINRIVFNYVYDKSSHKLPLRVKLPERLEKTAEGLTRQFRWHALVNLLCSPFIAIFITAYFFFRYTEEFRTSPSKLGARDWTRYAYWKIRHLNELPHYYHERAKKAHDSSVAFLNCFTNEPLNVVARFVAFIAGSFLAVLTVLSFLNENFLLHGHLLPDRSVLWFMTVFGVIVTIARAILPSETATIEPKRHMTRVMTYTHYRPARWMNREHTPEVAAEFAQLFQFKIVSFLMELLSVVINPYVLFFVLPKRSKKIIEFVRDNTKEVPGVGEVCSFADFNLDMNAPSENGFRRNSEFGEPAREHTLKDAKLEKSFVNFTTHNPKQRFEGNNAIYLSDVERHKQNTCDEAFGASSYAHFEEPGQTALNQSIAAPLLSTSSFHSVTSMDVGPSAVRVYENLGLKMFAVDAMHLPVL